MFHTLKSFSQVVSDCRVALKNRELVPLEAGLQKCVVLFQDVERNRRKVIMVGNGGSAAIASHQAVDLWKNGGIRAIAFNDASLLTCVGNDFGYPEVFSKPIEQFADPGDCVVVISSSGKSANILNAAASARKMGCSVIGFSGFGENNPLSDKGDVNFYLKSDSYGIVEVGHLLLLHAIIDETIRQKASR